MVFYCFLTNIFQITFKYLQNIVRLCFHFVKFPWEKYNMLGADEDGRMLFLHNELLVYIFKCKWNRETAQFLHKIFSYVQFNQKNHCCNVSLNRVMTCDVWEYSMANILINYAVQLFFQIWKQWEKLFRSLQLQCIGRLFQ